MYVGWAETGTTFAQYQGWTHIKTKRGLNMNLVFGYRRENPVKIEKDTSKLFLLIVGLVIVVLFLFLTFENIDEESSIPSSPFQASICRVQEKTLDGIDITEIATLSYQTGNWIEQNILEI